MLFFLLLNFSFASYQKVRIGKIDSFYDEQLSKEQLKAIIDGIEHTFESQLKMNIFDYSENGKPIDIIYVAPSKLENKILLQNKKLKKRQEEIEKYKINFPKEQHKLKEVKELFKQQNEFLNKKVKSLNDYVREINKRKQISKQEYKKIQAYINKRKKSLNKDIKALKKEEKNVSREIHSFNKKVNRYNNLIINYKMLNNELESMIRGFKKVKGRTIGIQEVIQKTYYKNGRKIKERKVSSTMNKIEIYGFDNLLELKATLAHEIAHLVGIPHINKKHALMNPILQKNQLKNLYLTYDDIRAFKENF